jgi:PAS domain S-box-containing protein
MEIKNIRYIIIILIMMAYSPSRLFAGDDGSKISGDRQKNIQKINQIIKLSKGDNVSPGKKFDLAYEIMKLSIENSYTPGKAEFYFETGNYFVYQRKHEQAIRFLLSAAHLYSVLKDTIGMMMVDQSIYSVEIALRDYKNALKYCSQGLEFAHKRNDLLRTGIFLEKMADIFQEQLDTSKSLDYYMESLKYYTEAKARKKVLGVYMSIGGIYLEQKRFSDVIKMYDSLTVFADSVLPDLAGTMYTRIAHVYDVEKQYPKALLYNKRALRVRVKGSYPDAVNSSVINIAGDFFKMNRPDSGWLYIERGLQEAKKYRRTFYLKNAYNILYNYYVSTGNYQKALENLKLLAATNDSILKERLNADINLIQAGQNVLNLNETNKILETQNNLKKSLIRNQKIFRTLLIGIIVALLFALAIISRSYLRHRRSKMDVENLNIKLQYEADERKLIQKKNIEKEEHYRFIAEHSLDLITRINIKNNIIYASPASAAIYGYEPEELLGMSLFDLALPGYREYLKEQLSAMIESKHPASITFLARKKKNEPVWIESTLNPVFDTKTGEFKEIVAVSRNIQELKKREMGIVEGTKQKENLLREIHHRVKNNFAILVSLINMQKAQNHNPEVLQSLTNLQLRIRTMALVHEMLYRSEDFEKISLADYFRSVASMITATYGRMSINIEFEMDPVIINIEAAIPLGLIMNELLSNVYRHAFSQDSPGTVKVTLKKQEGTRQYAVSVSDSGKGLPEGFTMEGNKTMGLQIVDILVKQIEASLQIIQDKGTTFTILFAIEH